MPLIIPLLAGFALVVTAPFLILLLNNLRSWLRPQLPATLGAQPAKTKPSGGPLAFAFQWAFDAKALLVRLVKGRVVLTLDKAMAWVEHWVSSTLAHAAAPGLRASTMYLRGLATISAETALHISGLAKATYDALNTLRNVTVPNLIKAAVAPVAKLAAEAKTLALDAEGRLDAARVALLAALAKAGVGSFTTLAQGLTALVNYADRTYEKLYKDIAPKVEELWTVRVPDLTDQVGIIFNDLYGDLTNGIYGIRTRLRDLENLVGKTLAGFTEAVIAALGTVAGLAALEALLRKIAPNLFCRNTSALTKRACGIDNLIMDDFLALIGSALVIGNLRDTVRVLQSITRETTEAIRVIAEV